ncbi:MAG TPA: AAA family ATPase [Acidimicrobiales bacterium]|jgi:chromosome partitioning protein|nr:AAA family ATPase [Acidimicrobiales bacterium]
MAVVEPVPPDAQSGHSVDDERGDGGSGTEGSSQVATPSEASPSEASPSEVMPIGDGGGDASGGDPIPLQPRDATGESPPQSTTSDGEDGLATSQAGSVVTEPGTAGTTQAGTALSEATLGDTTLADTTLGDTGLVTAHAEAGVLDEEAPPPRAMPAMATPEPAVDTGGQPIPAMAPRSQPRPLPRTLAIANQKGGVGKTTTAVNLGAGLAALGYRTLVVDLDPQGNATTGLGIDARNLSASIYDVLLADRPLEDAVEPTAVRNLFVVPATLDLAGAEIELVPAFSRELKLRRAVDGLDGQFDFTLIDCPPSLGLLTVNGLAAADEVLVPVQCEYYALEGLGQLLRNIQLVQSNLNPVLELSTIVLTMYDARTKLSDQVASEVRTHFGERVCRNIVPRSVRLSEAPSFGQPIIVFDPTSRGSIAYRELAKEVSGGAPRRTG